MYGHKSSTTRRHLPMDDVRRSATLGRPTTPLPERIHNALRKYGVLTGSYICTLTGAKARQAYRELDEMILRKEVVVSTSPSRVAVYYLRTNKEVTLGELFPEDEVEQPEILEQSDQLESIADTVMG